MKNSTENNSLNLKREDTEKLKERVKPYLTEKRYAHTVSVMREAEALGQIFMPEKVEKLRASALLHDITKKEDEKKQLQYCRDFGIMVEIGVTHSFSVLHAISGAYLVSRDFADCTDSEIISGVRWHTTGHGGMTDFEAIIYLADFIEETRTFDDCKKLREFFYSRLDTGKDKHRVLYETMVYSFDLTLGGLIKDNSLIDRDTVDARNYYIAKLTAYGRKASV